MPDTYYKTTNEDGGSFGDPSVLWRVGQIVRDPRPTPTPPIVGVEGLLHAATMPTEALTSYKTVAFPFRLYSVEPLGTVHATDDEWPLIGCRAWKVVAELDPALALGPQGRQVLDLIERAKRLTPAERERLAAAWLCDEARDAARFAAVMAAHSTPRIVSPAVVWDAACEAAWEATRSAAATDAVIALLVRHRVTEEHFRVLAAPWMSVVGEL